jgi:hypothetical protein
MYIGGKWQLDIGAMVGWLGAVFVRFTKNVCSKKWNEEPPMICRVPMNGFHTPDERPYRQPTLGVAIILKQ